MKHIDFRQGIIPDGFFWFNEPVKHMFENGLTIMTGAKTDFWQTTHYGFKRDDGHCLLTKTTSDFLITTRAVFNPVTQYDQCGLMARIDSCNWIKCSTEFEDTKVSRLGSVVTNNGYSDWATHDISSELKSMFYRIAKKGKDFLIQYSHDGAKWHQMRIAHLHSFKDTIDIGVYACSPIGHDFKCSFEFIEISANEGYF